MSVTHACVSRAVRTNAVALDVTFDGLVGPRTWVPLLAARPVSDSDELAIDELAFHQRPVDARSGVIEREFEVNGAIDRFNVAGSDSTVRTHDSHDHINFRFVSHQNEVLT